jgi:3-hydroxybutyryl-CoA dehydrogenase
MSFVIRNQSVAVVGGGTMGVGIVYVHAAAGYQVYLAEPDASRVEAVRATLRDVVANGIKRGKINDEQSQHILNSVRFVPDAADLPEALDLVIETVPERQDLKLRVLKAIDQRRPQLIATNTSALSIDALAAAVTNKALFLGMHFFNPVWSLPMVELIRGKATSDWAMQQARDYATACGKVSISVHDVPGFATSRLDLAASLEAMRMLQDGVATAEDIDRAMVVAYRHPIGPLRLSDVVGLDVRLDIARNLQTALGERYAPPRILEELVARGDLGQKTGKGFFDWSKN